MKARSIALVAIVSCWLGGSVGSAAATGIVMSKVYSASNPIDGHRDEDGYVRVNVEYQGHNQFYLDDEPISTNPMHALREFELPPSGHRGFSYSPEDLLEWAEPGIAEVTDFGALPLNVQAMPVEQRALVDVMDRLAADRPVNILPGSLYTPYVRDYVDTTKGAYDAAAEGFLTYNNAFLYLEKNGPEVGAVVVDRMTYGSRQLDRAKMLGGGIGHFYTTSRGVSRTEEVKGDFVTEWHRYAEWTARHFFGDCPKVGIASNCLYKANQKQSHKGKQLDFTFYGEPQIILVSSLQLFERDQQVTERGDRDIETAYVLPVAKGVSLYTGRCYGQYTSHGSSQDLKLVTERGAELMKTGGTVYGGSQIAALRVYRMIG